MAVTLKGNNGTYEGTSEDNKPLDVPVNTEFDELDTGKTYYFDGETWNEEPPCEGGGFTPTAEQLAAMNSGITAEDVAQIATNKNNISTVSDANGTKNLLDFNDWASKVNATRATKSISGNSITLTATGKDAYTDGVTSTCPASGKIACEPNTTYVITWETTSESTSDIVYIFPANASPYYRAATTKYIEYTMPAGCRYFTFRFGVANSGDTVTYSNIMICEKSLYDISNQYKPYALSNAELTAKEQQNENNILYNTNNGAKNVVPLKTSVSTGNADVTFVQNADKSYTLTLSATMSTNLAFDISDTFTLDSNIQYVLSGNPSSGAIRLVLAEGTSPFSWIEQQYADNPATITPVADKVYKLSLFIYANTAAITLTIKPMICSKSAWDVSQKYVPYAMSNAELTAAIQAIQAQLANT